MARQTYLVEHYRPELADLHARAGIPFERIQPAIADAGRKETP